MIDSHAHLNDPKFARDLDQVVSRANAAGVEIIINVGYDLESSQRAVELASQYPGLFAVVGLHPHDAKTSTPEISAEIEKLAADPKVVAIGEIGLDYYYDHSPREKQQEVFREYYQLAAKLDLPVVIHSRKASRDTFNIVREFPQVPSLLHCYSGSLETAQEYRKMGHYFSFGGPITFRNAHKLRGIVAQMPLEWVLLETDCPYLTPHPYRGKRNEPSYLEYVAQKLAQIHGVSVEEIKRVTAENTRKFFRLPFKEENK
ncbi:MAG: TatD family hydrolase [Firmicutes bacterium]|nr:TatD family hydrolase [Bacillota bacterium]